MDSSKQTKKQNSGDNSSGTEYSLKQVASTLELPNEFLAFTYTLEQILFKMKDYHTHLEQLGYEIPKPYKFYSYKHYIYLEVKRQPDE